MTFRTRLALASAIAVAAAIAAASLVSYGSALQLRGSIDDALRTRARQVQIPQGRIDEFGAFPIRCLAAQAATPSW